MMAMDTALQVWLDTVPGPHAREIVPYVRSPEDGTLRYQLNAVRHGDSGTATVQQSGTVPLRAGKPTALTRFSLSVGAQDQCRIELVLFANGLSAGTYQFACPRTP